MWFHCNTDGPFHVSGSYVGASTQVVVRKRRDRSHAAGVMTDRLNTWQTVAHSDPRLGLTDEASSQWSAAVPSGAEDCQHGPGVAASGEKRVSALTTQRRDEILRNVE